MRLLSQEDISRGSACEIWDCRIALGGESQSMILKVFTPGFADVAKIGPVNTARKCALALSEMPIFSANLLLGSDGLKVIDWEMLALGDPMWDLGFLIGADRGLPAREVDRVIATYSSQRPVDTPVLMWHKTCWDTYWALTELARQLRPCSRCH